MGPADWLDQYEMFALARYESVRTESFPSSHEVMMKDDMKKVLRGNTLCCDGAAHDKTRKVDERRSYTAVIGYDRRRMLFDSFGFPSKH